MEEFQSSPCYLVIFFLKEGTGEQVYIISSLNLNRYSVKSYENAIHVGQIQGTIGHFAWLNLIHYMCSFDEVRLTMCQNIKKREIVCEKWHVTTFCSGVMILYNAPGQSVNQYFMGKVIFLLMVLHFIYFLCFFVCLKYKFRKCILSNWKKVLEESAKDSFRITSSHVLTGTCVHYHMMVTVGSSDLRAGKSRCL